jgi:hypothetical protein
MAEKTEFLPFNAINEFMRPDFRLNVIRDTLNSQSSLDEQLTNELNQQIKKNVSIPGFRSSDKAPTLVKVVPTSKAFEKKPDLVAIILACWAEIHSQLRDEVYSVLRARNWKILPEGDLTLSRELITTTVKEWPVFPLSMNRAKLPGFYTHWPKGEDFEAIYTQYNELYPEAEAGIDKVGLMAVWLTMRLPYHVDEISEDEDKQISENSSTN